MHNYKQKSEQKSSRKFKKMNTNFLKDYNDSAVNRS